MNATLTRTTTGDAGTFGTLKLDDGTTYFTGELPERNNEPRVSCIPPGIYDCAIYDSPVHGPVYLVNGVPGRSYIEIHAANWFGDKAKGLRCDMLGCIGLGYGQGELGGQQAILKSQPALLSFMGRQQGQPFKLTIVEAFGAGARA